MQTWCALSLSCLHLRTPGRSARRPGDRRNELRANAAKNRREWRDSIAARQATWKIGRRGVFLAYASPKGHTLLDRELYLPMRWIKDRQRCQDAGIPDTVRFQTKCEQARQMIERLWLAKVPFAWVVADTVYGGNEDLRTWLEVHGYSFVLAVACDEPVEIHTPQGLKRMTVAEAEASCRREQEWQRLSMSQGTKGPRLFDWAVMPMLHRCADDGRHFLLIRRCMDDPSEKTYSFVFAPLGTTLVEMVQAIGQRWKIEECFEIGKGIGLEDYEVRGFTAWYRHITLVMLVQACLAGSALRSGYCLRSRLRRQGYHAPAPCFL